MDTSADQVHVTAGDDADAVAEAAALWARAKSRRDQDLEPVSAEQTRPGLEERLRLEGATLLLARRAGRPVGFTLFAPHPQTLEVFYLAVDPDAWGTGVAGQLLQAVDDQARELGREALELWVIHDNDRAIGVYRNSGWIGTEETQRNGSGRLERRFTRDIRSPVVR